MSNRSRGLVMAVIGNAGVLSPEQESTAFELGRLAVDAGFSIITGGLDGVMSAASRGGRSSVNWREGKVIGVIPGYDRSSANPYVDIVIATGAQMMRNVIVVASSDCVAVIGGGAGTLSEIALGWQLGKPILSLVSSGGWAERLAGQTIDHRNKEPIHSAASAEDLVQKAALLCQTLKEPGEIGSGWRKK